MSIPRPIRCMASGLVGASVLTAIHETARRRHPDAPRMDLVGMRALRQLLRAGGLRVPPRETVHQLALAGDIVSNSLYYATVSAPTARQTWLRGIVLGAAAGAGALKLPPRIGLGNPPKSERRANQVMTVAWYVAGGLAAAAAANLMRGPARA
jgi:hypothetical protein